MKNLKDFYLGGNRHWAMQEANKQSSNLFEYVRDLNNDFIEVVEKLEEVLEENEALKKACAHKDEIITKAMDLSETDYRDMERGVESALGYNSCAENLLVKALNSNVTERRKELVKCALSSTRHAVDALASSRKDKAIG